MQCSRLTRKGFPCPIHADRVYEGHPVCHVHDPAGLAAENRNKSGKPQKEGQILLQTGDLPKKHHESPDLVAVARATKALAERLESLESRLSAIETAPRYLNPNEECPFEPQLLGNH